MKHLNLLVIIVLFFCGLARAQNAHDITGSIIDTTKMTVPGASVKLKTDLGDSTVRVTGIDGKFTFAGIKANKITLTISSIGYQGVIKHFTFANDDKPLNVGAVILKTTSKMLSGVTIVGINPVVLKEDTTQYSAAAYKVRDNAPVEDLVKKLPGVDVDADGNVSTKGKQITKVRINGKDVFGGDLQSITKNLPADVVENIQMIDDYGDQANLTGIKTGEPNQIMNITIRKDKNYGYSANMTGGAGRDALPAPETNDTRYSGLVNAFKFKGDQQLFLLGNLNNTNARTFNFGGGGGGFGGGGGGGRGNAARGGGGGNAGVSTQNGITAMHAGGINYRDQWGKWSVYGSYSVADNTTNTISSTKQESYNSSTSVINNQASNDKTESINHRVTWNMEWKPDTINYLKITPTFSYAKTITNYSDEVNKNNITNGSTQNTHYTSTAFNSISTSPTYGAAILYNHRFNGSGRNFSVFINASTSHSDADQNPIYNYIAGPRSAPVNQLISNGSLSNSISSQFSYIEPLSKRSFLEANYTYSHSHTTSDKLTDTLSTGPSYVRWNDASNSYAYNFTTNRFGLNYRFIEQKYNYTLGLAVQPATLEGSSLLAPPTTKNTFNWIPTARFIYNFSRSQSFSANYNGSSNQPTFSQLQPVYDFSNASYPVIGNANLSPEFNHNIQIRYNQFSFQTGDVMFFNLNITKTDNKIVTNSITYPTYYSPNPRLQNTITSTYLNANGYYTGNFQFTYAKPWEARKYTVALNGNINYINGIGYLTAVDSIGIANFRETTQKNIAKSLTFTPNISFRTDITDVIDSRLQLGYSITKVDNSVKTALTQASSDVRAFTIGLNGKNYFWKDWTLSYDYSKVFNYGYTQKVTNPNLLAVYVERRFLKNNMATLRATVNDVFNQNAGYSLTPGANGGSTETSVNRLGRYFLLTLNIRLQKFAGKAPDNGFPGGGGGGRRNREGRGGGGFGGGGGGFGGGGGAF